MPFILLGGDGSLKRRLSRLVLITVILISVITSSLQAACAGNVPQIKNIIYMIPDGGGFALFDFANAVKEAGGFNQGLFPNATAVEAGPMYMKDYLAGTVTTHSANKDITDSAAAGTALSSGYKTNNNYVGVDTQGRPRANVLEAAQLTGRRTGMCSTYEWTHATPAAFSAHNISRQNYTIMSEQIVNQGIDVVLGVGFGAAQWGSVNEAKKRGYTVVTNKTELAAVEQGTKLWGNLSAEKFPFDINLGSGQPTLAEMTRAAITALDGSDKGFFLMVEGSQVDTGGHSNDILAATSEYLAFDAAFKEAVEFASGRTDTVVIAVPDHDTGGLILPNPDVVGGNTNSSDYEAAVAEVRAGINSKNGISWYSKDHTARRCGVWMYVPEGVSLPQGLSATPGDNLSNRSLVIDNTAIAPYIAGLMGISLEAATGKLFVDVTSSGAYNTNNQTFTFNDADVSIKANCSTAAVKGREVDLKGEIAVYSNNKFYVPQRLMLMMSDLKIRTVRYMDNLTGRILIKGQVDKSFAREQASLILVKKDTQTVTEDDIGYLEQVGINSDGSYVFKFLFYDDINDYELRLYLEDKTITDSITLATASYSWLDAGVYVAYDNNSSSVSGNVIINNYFDVEGLTYTVNLAFYDAQGRLIGVSAGEDIKTVEGKITTDNINAAVPDGTASVKAIVWSNYSQMIPLCSADTAGVP